MLPSPPSLHTMEVGRRQAGDSFPPSSAISPYLCVKREEKPASHRRWRWEGKKKEDVSVPSEEYLSIPEKGKEAEAEGGHQSGQEGGEEGWAAGMRWNRAGTEVSFAPFFPPISLYLCLCSSPAYLLLSDKKNKNRHQALTPLSEEKQTCIFGICAKQTDCWGFWRQKHFASQTTGKEGRRGGEACEKRREEEQGAGAKRTEHGIARMLLLAWQRTEQAWASGGVLIEKGKTLLSSGGR